MDEGSNVPMKANLLGRKKWIAYALVAFAVSTTCEGKVLHDSAKLTESDFPQTEPSGSASTPSSGLQITVDESWHLDNLDNVASILNETASYIYSHLRDSPNFQVVVGYDREMGPISLYRNGDQQFDRVLLSNTPLEYRPQIMYQFSHEFCHVISDYNRIRSTDSKNEWFHEALCELASIFVLHSTEEPALKKYIDDYLEESRDTLAGIEDFGTWISSKEEGLRTRAAGRHDRKTNAVVAYRLHPLFKQYPALWNTLWHLPKSDSTLAVYIEEWKQAIDDQDSPLLDKLQELLLGTSDKL